MLALALLAGGPMACGEQPPPSSAPGAEQGKPATPAAPAKPADAPAANAGKGEGAIDSAEKLLDALESADKDLRTFQADIIWTKMFDLGGDRHVRSGRLYFADERSAAKAADAGAAPATGADASKPAGVRKFAVHFDKLYIGQRLEEEPKHYIFDGQWLIEKMPAQKKLARYEIVREGQHNDPLKLGEGPMPLPIGQRKADIVKRFGVELLPAEQDLAGESEEETAKLKAFVQGCYQLKLTIKPEAQEESKFGEVRLWYQRGDGGRLVPRMARTIDRAGDVDLVRLGGEIKVNASMEETFDTKTPEGWEEQAKG